jgi:2-keto-3-deoxy-L-fuconate dehydrogenase
VLSNDAVDALAREIGPVHVIANCAGYVAHGTVLECDERSWDFSFDLNVKSMHRVIKAFLPGMLENGGGSIVNIASGASSLKGAPNRYVYGTTKAAVIGLTKAVAIDFIARASLQRHLPRHDPVAVPRRPHRRPRHHDEQVRAGGPRHVHLPPTMGRLGTPEEVAHLAVYLASDESAFTTGTTAVIDGGWTL